MTREQRVSLQAAAVSDVADTSGAVVLRAAEAPDSPMLNRVVGLGLGRVATEADLDEALAAVGTGISFYVALAPGARPPALADWLRARGLEPGWGWMSFRRGVDDPPPAETSLRIAEVVGEAAAAAALYVAERAGYLGFAGTLSSHRGKGAQSALPSERVRRARQLGCDLLVTETGERRDDRPSNSYRNILRAGFSEVDVTANWLGRR